MTWKRGNSSLPLEIFLKPQESANARRFSFAVAGTISWTVCLCVCLSECNMLLDMPPDQRFPYWKLPKREHGYASEWAAGGPGHVFAIFASALLAAI